MHHSVMSTSCQGWRFNITANHSRSLGTTTNVPDLTDGIHELRIKYDPIFDDEAISHPSFQANGFSSWFYEVMQSSFHPLLPNYELNIQYFIVTEC
jgi:hypothetical protein